MRVEYSFYLYNKFAADGLTVAAEKLLRMKTGGRITKPPVVVCVGSDLAIGDSLGPITGSMLKFKTQGLPVFLYGTLASPVTAREIKYLRTFLKETHKGSPIIAVDAAVGQAGDVGLIKINDAPLKPGAGANKHLGNLGDISIMGVVAEKSIAHYNLLNGTRLNLVYTMSEIISTSLSDLLLGACAKEKMLSKIG